MPRAVLSPPPKPRAGKLSWVYQLPSLQDTFPNPEPPGLAHSSACGLPAGPEAVSTTGTPQKYGLTGCGIGTW